MTVSRTIVRISVSLALVAVAATSSGQAPARIDVEIRQNGETSGCTGSWEVRRPDGSVAARGTSAGSARVAAGTYRVVVAIDGVLDRPTRTFPVTVAASRSARVDASFSTGTLTASVTRGGQRAAAMIEILRSGQRVATLASGVRGTLSAGAYVLRARHRGETRETGVTVTAGSEVTAELAFP